MDARSHQRGVQMVAWVHIVLLDKCIFNGQSIVRSTNLDEKSNRNLWSILVRLFKRQIQSQNQYNIALY